MDRETEAVAGAVEKSNRAVLGALGLIAGPGKAVRARGVHGATVHAGADRLGGEYLGLAHGGDEPPLHFAGTALEVGAGHVAVIAGLQDARENIDDDELVRTEQTGAAFVRVAGLVATSHDGVAGVAALLTDGRFQLEAESLRGQHLAAMDEGAALDLRGPQNAFGHGETDRAEPVALTDAGGLPRGLDFPLGEQQAVGELELQAELGESEVEGSGKIVRDPESALAVGPGEGGDDLGNAGLGAVALLGLGQPRLLRQDDVEGAGALDAAEFQRPLRGDLLPAGAKGNERVVHLDPAEIEHVGAGVGVGVKEGRGIGFAHRSDDWGLRDKGEFRSMQ